MSEGAGPVADGENGHRLDPLPVSAGYRVGIALVSVGMIVLPAVYLALVLGLAILLVLHVSAFATTRGEAPGGIIEFFVPVLIGGILLFFMLKPLLARRSSRSTHRTLEPEVEPRLFEFARDVAHAVGAPAPSEIRVDLDVNASASFRRGLLSFLGSDLRLTIGVPLLARLTRRQLAGVLAHEFGHFSQGAGMRLSHVIRTVNGWFARVVYQRDAWDESLARWSKRGEIRIMILLLAARLSIWVIRGLLWVLMVIAHAMGAFLLRQMEYDADRYQVRFAGSTAFVATYETITTLQVAWLSVESAVEVLWADERLPDRLVEFLSIRVDRLNAEDRQGISDAFDEQRTGTFDTHPSKRDRIAAATREDVPGLYREEGPAADLVADLAELDRSLSRDVLRAGLRHEFRERALRPVAEITADLDRREDTVDAGQRFYRDVEHVLRMPSLPESLPEIEDVDAAVATLRDLRDEFPARAERWNRLRETYDKTLERGAALRWVGAMHRSGYRVAMEEAGFRGVPQDDLSVPEARIREHLEKIALDLTPAEDVIRDRLTTALALLDVATIREKIEGGDALRSERDRLLAAAHVVVANLDTVAGAGDGAQVLSSLLEQLRVDPDKKKLNLEVEETGYQLRRGLGALADAYRRVPFPFEHGGDGTTLRTVFLPHLPAERDSISAVRRAGEFLQAFPAFVARLLYRLGAIAERAEEAVGLPPLPYESERATDDPPPSP